MDKENKTSTGRRRQPAATPEARENQLIAMAMDAAEEQLRNGTASNQVISHFLKLGSTRDNLEKRMILEKTKLVTAQVESIESQKRVEVLYEDALNAMRAYRGSE